MDPERETLEARKCEAEEKARSLRSYIRELTETAGKCCTDGALIEEALVMARNDAELHESTAASLAERIAAQDDHLTYWVRHDAAGEWRWNLRAANNRIIADSGEGYRHKQDCVHAIELVKSSAKAQVNVED